MNFIIRILLGYEILPHRYYYNYLQSITSIPIYYFKTLNPRNLSTLVIRGWISVSQKVNRESQRCTMRKGLVIDLRSFNVRIALLFFHSCL